MIAQASEGPPVQRTRLLGRLVRGLIGLGLLGALSWPVGRLGRLSDPATGADLTVWLLTAISLLAVPTILDDGLAWGHGTRVQVLLTGIGLALMVSNMVLYDQLWTGLLALYMILVQAWALGTLGLAYVLAAALATPGNELRSFAHLSSRLSSQRQPPRLAPGALDRLDAWEAQR